MGKSAYVEGRILWVPRSLRPYESSASIVAKSVFLGKTVAKKNFNGIFNRLTSAVALDIGPTRPVFDIDAFTALSGEQLRRTRLCDPRNLKLPSDIAGSFPVDESNENCLWICYRCLREGYHSFLHQYRWLKRCFVHDELLRPCDSSRKSQTDLEMAESLFAKWFASDRDWSHAREPMKWRQSKRSRYLRAIPELVRQLRATSRWATEKEVCVGPALWQLPDPAHQLKLLVCASQWGRPPPSKRLMSLLSIKYETFEQTALLHLEVEAIGSVRPRELGQMAVEWFRQSMATNDPPQVLLEIQDHIYRLVEGHERCFEILKQGARRWLSIWPLKHDPARSNRVLRQLLECRVGSCEAIQLIEALRVARPSFDGWQTRRRPPWFEHEDLRGAVLDWLGGQKPVATARATPFDPRLIPLFVIMVDEMIGTALEMELCWCSDDLEGVKWEELAAASTGLGTVVPEFGAEWRGVPFCGLLLVKIEGRFQLLRERQMLRLNRVVPSAAHFEKVVEVCCAVEAATQLRWPTPGFMRLINLPVSATHVERFMRMWGAVDPDIGSTLLPEDSSRGIDLPIDPG